MADPQLGRVGGLVPFHNKLLHDVSEAVLRVILAVLADPRTEELFSDILRDNITQIRTAIDSES